MGRRGVVGNLVGKLVGHLLTQLGQAVRLLHMAGSRARQWGRGVGRGTAAAALKGGWLLELGLQLQKQEMARQQVGQADSRRAGMHAE